MLSDKIQFEILTPIKKVYSDEIASVRVPGATGYFGVYPGHTPFLSTMQIGQLKVETEGEQTRLFATTGGIVEVQPNKVSVLADTCEAAEEIDVERAEDARQRAEKRIANGRREWDIGRAQIALARAINRIKAASLR